MNQEIALCERELCWLLEHMHHTVNGLTERQLHLHSAQAQGVLDRTTQHLTLHTRDITWRRNSAVKTPPRSLASTWGTTAAERTLSFPCDRYLSPFDAAYFRAVPVRAPAPIVFRWLCQLRVAPYSYDWIDNGGHLSPRELIPGLDQLQVGQRVMTIFQLVDFEPNRHLTLRLRASRAKAIFGEIGCSYVILPREDAWCRLVVKLLVRYPPGFTGAMMRQWLPWGDLFMMRKQLLTLKHLAEQQSKDAEKE